jgi:hypothetical protein
MRRLLPTIYLRKDTPYYWLAYYDRAGRRIRRSSGTKDKRQAQRELQKAVAQVAYPTPAKLTIDEAFALFEENVPRAVSTRKADQRSKRRWREYLAAEKINTLGTITPVVVDAFVAHFLQLGLARRTLRHDLDLLSKTWQLLRDWPGLKSDLPCRPVDKRIRARLKPYEKHSRTNDDARAEWLRKLLSHNTSAPGSE